MALDIILIGLGWLLAAASAVLWLRKFPQQLLGRGYPSTQRRGWRANAILIAAVGFAAFGGAGLERHHLWNSLAAKSVAYGPVVTLAFVAPVLTRRWQLRHSASQPAGLNGSAGIPPAV